MRPTQNRKRFWNLWVLAAITAGAGAIALGVSPFLIAILAICPLMMMGMHGDHGGHDHGDHEASADEVWKTQGSAKQTVDARKEARR